MARKISSLAHIKTEILLSAAILGLLGIIVYFGNIGIKTYAYMKNGNAMASSTERYQRTGNNQQRILILGDSLAYGVGASKPEASFAGMIGARFPAATIINMARIGQDTAELARSLQTDLPGTYSQVYVLIGGNDIAHHAIKLEQSAIHLENILNTLSQKAEKVYLYPPVNFNRVNATPSLISGYYSQRSRKFFDAALAAAKPHANVRIVDGFDYDRQEYQSLQASDGFHLNDKGIAALVNLTFEQHPH